MPRIRKRNPFVNRLRPGTYEVKGEETELISYSFFQRDIMAPLCHQDHRFNDLIKWELFFREMNGSQWLTDRGSWPKRFARGIKRYGLTLHSDQISRIGKLVKDQITSMDLILHLSRIIDWTPGAYGDTGSCFFGCRKGARGVIEDNGGMVSKLHNLADSPLSRALVVPNGKGLALFNCYTMPGFPVDLQTHATALQKIGGFRYRTRIGLSQNGKDSNLIYINSGRGVVLSDEPIPTGGLVNLSLVVRCDDCNKDMRYRTEPETHNYRPICNECAAKYYQCDWCGEEFKPDASLQPFMLGNRSYCPKCYPHHKRQCQRCGRVTNSRAIRSVSGVDFCVPCFDVFYRRCNHCNLATPLNQGINTDCGNFYCMACCTRIATIIPGYWPCGCRCGEETGNAFHF